MSEQSLSHFLWQFIRPRLWLFALIQFFSFAWSIDNTLWPYVFQHVVDAIAHYTGDKALIWQVLAVPLLAGLALWLTIELFFRLSGIISAWVFPALEADIRMRMFNYVQLHSHNYFANHFAGSIANKISDMPSAATNILQLAIFLFIPALMALLIALVLFMSVEPVFAAILFGWVMVHIGICLISARKCNRYSEIHAEAKSTLAGKIVDSLSNQMNVRLFSRMPFESHYLTSYQGEERKLHIQSLWYIEKIKIALGAACFLGVGVLMTWYMISSWQAGKITIGEVVFIFQTTWNITLLAWIAGLELPNLFKEIGVAKQALTIMHTAHEVTDKPDAEPLKVTKGEIVFDKVTFHYQRNQNVFKEKSVTIQSGQKVGLVGFSGSGKTTFVNLILRLFDVAEGRILIDGQDILHVTQSSLRENIAMIPQDTQLFHRSLMENIRYGSQEKSDEEVIEAAKRAHCHEFIMKLEKGYDTLVGERGIKLSGGQRQRIAIARAILKNAPIIILDEATSSLDSVTEVLIQESLASLMEGRTTIVIAHRLSTLSGMDRILVFKEGQIIEDGTHEQLMTLSGHYATLWQMQSGGFLPEKPMGDD